MDVKQGFVWIVYFGRNPSIANCNQWFHSIVVLKWTHLIRKDAESLGYLFFLYIVFGVPILPDPLNAQSCYWAFCRWYLTPLSDNDRAPPPPDSRNVGGHTKLQSLVAMISALDARHTHTRQWKRKTSENIKIVGKGSSLHKKKT